MTWVKKGVEKFNSITYSKKSLWSSSELQNQGLQSDLFVAKLGYMAHMAKHNAISYGMLLSSVVWAAREFPTAVPSKVHVLCFAPPGWIEKGQDLKMLPSPASLWFMDRKNKKKG